MKEITVEYGKEKYTRNALTGEPLMYLGLRLMPKVVGLSSVIGCIVGNKFMQGENVYSFHKVIADVFEAEDWKWLLDELFYKDVAIKLNNGKYLSNSDEIDEHFAGDFVRFYTVALKFAWANLGEFSILTASLNGLAKNIADCLKSNLEFHVKDLEQSFKQYESSSPGKSAKGKPKNK